MTVTLVGYSSAMHKTTSTANSSSGNLPSSSGSLLPSSATQSKSSPQRRSPPTSISVNNNPWVYPSSDTASTMIGPTSTFYDPDNATGPQNTRDYQQWLNAYGHQSYGQAQQSPTQNQYQYDSGQYSMSHYAETRPRSNANTTLDGQYSDARPRPNANPTLDGHYSDTRPRLSANSSSGSLHGAVSYLPPQNPQGDLYYIPADVPTYSQSQPLYSPSALTNSSVHSPDPAIPNGRSQTSLSPPTWVEDGVYPGNTSAAPRSSINQPPAPRRSATKHAPVRPAPTSKRPAPKTQSRKRQRKAVFQDREHEQESDSDSEDDGFDPSAGMGMGGGISVGMGGLGVGSDSRSMVTRLPGACTHCKKLKMKCDFPKNDNTCKRCKAGGHVCIVEGRKPRTAPNKREYLLAQIRQKDAIIESLLKQLHNPYIATPLSIASYRMATSPSDQNNRSILAWLDRLQASVRTAGGKAGPRAFKLDARADGSGAVDEDDSDRDGSDRGPSEHQRIALQYGLTADDTDDADGDAAATVQGVEKLQSLPDPHVPLGLIANLSLSNTKTRKDVREDAESEENLDDDNVGVANETYFMPGPASDLDIRAMLIEKHSPPEILVHGLVAPEDVDKLFDIFFQRVNPFISLLDPVLHTPASTFTRCPFLFTVICAISSRYYSDKSEIYPIAMHFAKHAAANALIDGWKSVELCQAYILMSIYAVPARRWEEDRSWLYTGLAIRIATDLNLHQVSTVKPQSERQEREILNRTRVWMICFNLDRSTATQFGKPSTIKEDFVMRNSKDWYKRSKYNHPYDIHLCAYSALLRIVARFHDEIFSDPDAPTGLNKSVDFRSVTATHDGHLSRYQDEWLKRFAADSDPNDRATVFRCSLLPFLVGYSRLVMYSFGFQQAFHRGIQPGDDLFFSKCLDAAKSVIKNMIEGLAPSGYMRYAPDGHFIFASFASAFLLKLLRPEFSKLLVKEQENEIFDLIGRLIQTLSSPDIAIDDRHTPKLYARFLAGLLSKHRRDGATAGRLHTQPPPHNQLPPSGATGEYPALTPPSVLQSAAFSVSQSHGGLAPAAELLDSYQLMFNPNSDVKPNTPIYRPEATYTVGAGPIEFSGDFDMLGMGLGSGMSDEEMLATMQAVKNPAWWQNMMMPGFSWPEAGSPLLSDSSGNSPGSYSQSVQSVQSVNYGVFHTPEVPLH